jgi:hypothetical protein
VLASRVEASEWERGSVVVSAALKEAFREGCGIETQENIYISKVGVGKKKRK